MMSKSEEFERILAMRVSYRRKKGNRGPTPDDALVTFILDHRDFMAEAIKKHEEAQREQGE